MDQKDAARAVLIEVVLQVDELTLNTLRGIDLAFDVCEEIDQKTDRKSTRLNSSHVVISYAVFCLKKKKHTHV